MKSHEEKAHRLVGVPGHLVRLEDEHVKKRRLAMMKVAGDNYVAHHVRVVHHVEHEAEREESLRQHLIPSGFDSRQAIRCRHRSVLRTSCRIA